MQIKFSFKWLDRLQQTEMGNYTKLIENHNLEYALVALLNVL